MNTAKFDLRFDGPIYAKMRVRKDVTSHYNPLVGTTC